MRRHRRLASSLVAAAAAVVGLAGAGLVSAPSVAAPGPDDDVEVTVLGTNDFHGRIEADGQSAGAAVLAGAVGQFRTDNPNTVFAAAGDLIGASTFTSFIQDDNPTVEALNEAGLEVSAVGNHEFDQGYQDLLDRINGGNSDRVQATWEYLGANVKVKDGEDYDELAETWTTDLGGVTVGFVGVVTEHLPELVSPDGIAMLDVLDPTEAANTAAADLKADGADVVVLLVHEGAATTELESAVDPDSDFGAIVTGVNEDIDAIISGHTHLAYNHSIEVPEWVAEDRPVTERPVVSAGQYGYNLNDITFTVDPEGEGVQSVTSEIVPLAEEDEEGNWTPLFPADDVVQGIVDEATGVADELGNEPIGEVTTDINRAVQTDGSENRGGESTLGNLVADVQLGAAQVTDSDTQIAFMNPGGLRTDLAFASSGEGDPDGNVTFREVAEVQPFANTLVTTTLTGDQIVSVLEEQWQPAGASRPFLKLGVAGLTYIYDPAGADGEHVADVTLADGTPLDPAGEYRVVVNSFLASGGDNFLTLAEGADPRDTGQIDLEAMVAFFEASEEPVAPPTMQRAVGVTWLTEGPYAAGDEVAFDLSSLLFTDDEIDDATVTVALGDEVLAEAPVDPAIVDNIDDGGTASVSFTVPDDLGGSGFATTAAVETELAVTIEATGTTLTIPITLDDGAPGDDTGGESGGGDDGGTDDGAEAGDDGGAESGDDTGDAGTTESGTDDGEELPDTGSSAGGWIIGAVIVLALGGGLYAWSRRRASAAGPGDSSSSPPA